MVMIYDFFSFRIEYCKIIELMLRAIINLKKSFVLEIWI